MSSAELESNAPDPEHDQHLIAGRYRTLTRIGHGRLGEIYSAVDESYQEIGVEQHRAIQVIPESVVRNNKLFNKLNVGYSELRASSHPNLVDYIQIGRDGKFGFLAMELLDGVSLRLALDDAETLPLEEVRPVVRGVGEALRLLHTKGIVHGNLTTRNVFITEDLGVRLLDVLPVDPAEPLVRSIGTADPFSACTVEDDVFGLACLAYEMLSGRHPFNYNSPSEARTAGLEAERIDSLSDDEWDALHLALSFDREKRTSSIAGFMHAFGIDGSERLRPTVDQPTAAETATFPAEELSTPPTRAAVIAQPVSPVDPAPLINTRPAYARPVEERRSPLRAVLLGMLLASLGAWSYFGQPEEYAVDWIGYLDETLELGLIRQKDVVVDFPTVSSDRTLATDRDSQSVPAVAPVAASDPMQEDPDASLSEPESAASRQGMDVDSEQTTDQAEPVVTTGTERAMADSVEATIRPPDETTTESNTVLPGVASESIVTETIVTVSEGDAAARIVTERNINSGAPLIWWTSEHSAIADVDFVPVEQQTLNEDGDVLHIPLINDNLPERRESFFVNIGSYDAREGQIERIATVRVDIVDND
ncbi:MAG: protein kinase [Gammaproteobacteria bacterium]|nr:protein kinase [Gammaproteobacteria bacterium]